MALRPLFFSLLIASAVQAQPPERTEPRYLALSESVPQTTVSNYLEAIKSRPDDQPVTVAYRGFVPKQLDRLIGRLYQAAGEDLTGLNIEIHPVMFRDFNIERVPALIGQGADGVWRVVYGDSALDAAEKALLELSEAQETIGTTYPIEEPDLLAWVEEKITVIDWDQKIAALRNKVPENGQPTQMPRLAKDTLSYYVDPTITITQDIHGPDGALIASAGERINPLSHLPLGKPYVVFDATDPDQLAVIDHWIAVHPTAVAIATRLPGGDARAALGARFKREVYQANETLLRRFSISAVPALVVQDGAYLKVQNVNPDTFAR